MEIPVTRKELEAQLSLHDWRVARTAAFTAYTNAPEAAALRQLHRIDRFLGVVGRLVYGEPLSTSQLTEIYLFREVEQLHLFASAYTGGHAGRLDEGIFLALSVDRGFESTGVLYHELVHAVLLGDASREFPRWLHEGLAEFFSTATLRDGVLTVGTPPVPRLEAIRHSEPTPLDHLLGPVVQHTSVRKFLNYYADAWVFLHWALLGPSSDDAGRMSLADLDRRMRRLMILAAALHDGGVLGAACLAAFGEPFDQVESAYETHRSIMLESDVFAIWHFAVPVVEDLLELEAVGPGEIARELGRYAEFVIEGDPLVAALLDYALATTPGDAVALQARIRAAAADEDFSLAHDLWEQLPEEARNSQSAEWTAAKLAHAEYAASSPEQRARGGPRLHEARDRYRRVLESSSNRFRVLAALGDTYVLEEQGAPEPGIIALEGALQLKPNDASVRLGLATLLIRAGRVDDGRVHLRYLIEVHADSDVARKAKKLLKKSR